MAQILKEGQRLAHCFGRYEPTNFRSMQGGFNIRNNMRRGSHPCVLIQTEHETSGNETPSTARRRNSLSSRAKESVHDFAETTGQLTHEVKEKNSEYVTERDIVVAALKVADLQGRLINKQHQMKEVLLEVDRAEKNLNFAVCEKLKQKQVQLKNEERETMREMNEAEDKYWRLQNALVKQKFE